LDTQLYVIGDSHANCWNGTDTWLGEDSISGVRTKVVTGALAYNLIEEVSTTNSRHAVLETVFAALEGGFDGWFMLGFGAVDCQLWIWQYASSFGFEESVRRVVERYVAFLLELRQVHSKIAVWAPVAAHISTVEDTAVGTQVERNLALLVFTDQLRRALAAHHIPVISILDEMIGADGRTRADLYSADLTHFTQSIMPSALTRVNSTLGTTLQSATAAVTMSERRVTVFEKKSTIHKFDAEWLYCVLSEGAQLLSQISVWQGAFARAHRLSIATSVDAKTFDFFEVALPPNGKGPCDQQFIPIGRHARHILVRGHMEALKHEDLAYFVQTSQLSMHSSYHFPSLLAIRDALHAPDPKIIQSVTEDIAPVQFSAPPSMGVVFSAPPEYAELNAV
jgi:hypothetical protein